MRNHHINEICLNKTLQLDENVCGDGSEYGSGSVSPYKKRNDSMRWINTEDELPEHEREVIFKCNGYPPRIGCCIINPICKCKDSKNKCCRVWVIKDARYRSMILMGDVIFWSEIPEY